ncbi:hypothetical protein [Acetivibrio sp. MSJd-27]|nr:hypothetical protein [Acetivibrio sp. MSJd-27]
MFDKDFYWELFRNTGRLDAYVDYVHLKEEEEGKKQEEKHLLALR